MPIEQKYKTTIVDTILDRLVEDIVDNTGSDENDTAYIVYDLEMLDVNNNPEYFYRLIDNISDKIIERYMTRKSEMSNPYNYTDHHHKRFMSILRTAFADNDLVYQVENRLIKNVIDYMVHNISNKYIWNNLGMIGLIGKTLNSDFKEPLTDKMHRFLAGQLVGKYNYNSTIDVELLHPLLEKISQSSIDSYNQKITGGEIKLFLDVVRQIVDDEHFTSIVLLLYKSLISNHSTIRAMDVLSIIDVFVDADLLFDDTYKESIKYELLKGHTDYMIGALHRLKGTAMDPLIELDDESRDKIGRRIIAKMCSLVLLKKFWEYFETVPMSSKCFASAVINDIKYINSTELQELISGFMKGNITYEEIVPKIFDIV